MNASTWSVVAATFLGPIMAVIITLSYTYWRERSYEKYNRRLSVFRTLMSTRGVGVSPDHVNALNLVEVDFYGCKKVQDEWKSYKSHLLNNRVPEDDHWREERERLLSKLLFEMAEMLKFNISAIEIYKGGYYPSGWQYREFLYSNALKYITELKEGKNFVPSVVIRANQQEKPNDI